MPKMIIETKAIKATGIIRRIDDLGRLIIPKEIRKAMKIKENELFEIYTSGEDEIIFKVYHVHHLDKEAED